MAVSASPACDLLPLELPLFRDHIRKIRSQEYQALFCQKHSELHLARQLLPFLVLPCTDICSLLYDLTVENQMPPFNYPFKSDHVYPRMPWLRLL